MKCQQVAYDQKLLASSIKKAIDQMRTKNKNKTATKNKNKGCIVTEYDQQLLVSSIKSKQSVENKKSKQTKTASQQQQKLARVECVTTIITEHQRNRTHKQPQIHLQA